jgi:hypothetical protein
VDASGREPSVATLFAGGVQAGGTTVELVPAAGLSIDCPRGNTDYADALRNLRTARMPEAESGTCALAAPT